MALKREQMLKEQEGTAEFQETQAMLEEYKAMRGPSLMELHLSKHPRAKAATIKSNERVAFDREAVLLVIVTSLLRC